MHPQPNDGKSQEVLGLGSTPGLYRVKPIHTEKKEYYSGICWHALCTWLSSSYLQMGQTVNVLVFL